MKPHDVADGKMNIVENTLNTDLDAFLERPLFCHLAQISDTGPRVSPLWFSWDGEAIWIIAQLTGRSYPDRVRRDSRTAISIIDFHPATGRVEHVGMRGEARLQPYDEAKVETLLTNYLGPRMHQWPDRFADLSPTDYRLIEFVPETIVARDQSYPAATTGDT